MEGFTKRKFLALPLEQQHKKCAEWIKRLYERIDEESLWEGYREMHEWMNLPYPPAKDVKELSDAYHKHLRAAKQHVSEHRLLPPVRKGDKQHAVGSSLPIAIYLDHLRSAHNVGSIMRTVEAFNLGALYFSDDTPDNTHPQVQKTSMGTHEWLDAKTGIPLNSLPKPIVALETCENAIPIHEYLFPETFTLVVGNEEYGCSDTTLQQADVFVEIPLRGRKNSLNVANAFAIAAAEILRQRGLS